MLLNYNIFQINWLTDTTAAVCQSIDYTSRHPLNCTNLKPRLCFEFEKSIVFCFWMPNDSPLFCQHHVCASSVRPFTRPFPNYVSRLLKLIRNSQGFCVLLLLRSFCAPQRDGERIRWWYEGGGVCGGGAYCWRIRTNGCRWQKGRWAYGERHPRNRDKPRLGCGSSSSSSISRIIILNTRKSFKL